jgi:hypothetical protein
VTTILGSARIGFHAMRAFALVLFLCLTSLAAAQQQPRHHPYANWYEYAPKGGVTLQYNPYTKKRKYAPQGAMPRYNPYTNQRELVGPGETLQYNPYTKRREYAPQGAVPRYNPYTNQRELVGPG